MPIKRALMTMTIVIYTVVDVQYMYVCRSIEDLLMHTISDGSFSSSLSLHHFIPELLRMRKHEELTCGQDEKER